MSHSVKKFFIFALPAVVIAFGVLLFPEVVLAQSNNYQLIEESIPLGDNGSVPISDEGFIDFIRNIIQLTIAVATVLSVATIVFGGLQYMTTDAIQGKSNAKDKIQRAIGGLLLALSAFVILNTINPALVEIRGIRDVNIEVNTSGDDGGAISPPEDGGWQVDLAGGNTQTGFASAEECASWVESNNEGDNVTEFCHTGTIQVPNFSSISYSKSGWRHLDQDANTYQIYALYEGCEAALGAGDNCTLYDSSNTERATACEGNCQPISDYNGGSTYSGLRPRMKGNNDGLGKQCQWDYGVDSEDVGGGYKLIANNSNVITNPPLEYPDTCLVNQQLGDNLAILSNHTESSADVVDWRISEAWPPEVTHSAGCHKKGTCVDVGFTNNSDYTAENIANFIKAAKGELDNSFPSDLNPVFETSDENLCNAVVNQSGITADDVHLLNLPNHFSVYNDPTTPGGGCN